MNPPPRQKEWNRDALVLGVWGGMARMEDLKKAATAGCPARRHGNRDGTDVLSQKKEMPRKGQAKCPATRCWKKGTLQHGSGKEYGTEALVE